MYVRAPFRHFVEEHVKEPAEQLSMLSLLQSLPDRCIRVDKVATGVQSFVVSKMGDRFVKPPVFDLNACFDDSSCATPLVFILSPGSDPMGAVLKAAEGMGVKVMQVRFTAYYKRNARR